MQRTKGHGFERETVNKLKNVKGLKPERILEYQAHNANGIDVKAGNLDIQCKRGARYAPITRIEEVRTFEGRIPALVTRGDRKKAVICLYLDDFINIANDIGIIFEDSND
jgi:hypothetical protein